VREADGHVRVVIEPPIDLAAGADRDAAIEAAVRAYAARLEAYIRRYPEQYRSWHFPWWEPAA
jgi:lauroyl/myristoyl acyltransferase